MLDSSRGRLSWLNNLLSQQRFATYRHFADNNENRALELYQWNINISAGFMVPLHVFEVSLRNAVAEAIAASHGKDWHRNNGFLVSLPKPKPRQYSPYQDLKGARKKDVLGDVIVALKFAFWQHMLTQSYHKGIWKKNFQTVFPGVPSNGSLEIQRENLHKEVGAIRNFRNRIAHHEPIFEMPLEKYLAQIHNFVGWRSNEAAEWLRGLDPVPELLRKRPSWLDSKISDDG